MEIRAGTSGYSYKEWRGDFYPAKIAPAEMLSYYAARLAAVEINNTFYRMPRREVVESWASSVPEDFRFAELGAEDFVTVEDLLHLDRIIGQDLGGRVDGRQPTADHHGRQPDLQIEQGVAAEGPSRLESHQEVAGLADFRAGGCSSWG